LKHRRRTSHARRCNQTAAIREMMILLQDWKPMAGRGHLLATP
jgi:hypothetical protein